MACPVCAGGEPDPCAALVVEDHTSMRAVMARIVEGAGWHRVLEAPTVEQARHVLSWYTPALALVDVRLPDGNGEDIVRHIRALPHLASMAVVAMSADTDVDLRGRLLAAGADAYVIKSEGSHAVRAALMRAVASGSSDAM